MTIGDRGGAARDLAAMAMYLCRAPGIMAEDPSPAAALLAEAQAVSDGSPVTEAAIATATYHGDPAALDDAQRTVELAEQAERRLAADIDDPAVFGDWNSGHWRPWYAARWAEAAVLAGRPDAAERIRRSRHAARDNPIATAIVERAAAIAASDYDRLARFAITFGQLGCPYQQTRTSRLAADLR